MINLKKLLALFLMLACLFVLSACGNGENPAAGGSEEGKAYVPAAIRYTAAPAAAFGDHDNSRVIAVSADRNDLLIFSAYDLYIWDISAQKRLPVSFTAEADLELLNLHVDASLAIGPNNKKLTEEQLEKMREKGKNYLAGKNLDRFTNLDQIMECYPQMIQIRAQCIAMGDHFVLISENSNLLGMFTLDMRTGEARMIASEDISTVFPTLCGDRILTGVGITDLNTGEVVMPEYPEARTEPPEDYFAPRPAARLLPDGTVYAVVKGSLNSETKEVNCYLRKLSVAETGWELLGSYSMGASDFSLHITGNGQYAAVSLPSYARQSPVIINLETMEKRTLDTEDLIIIGEYDSGFICCNIMDGKTVRLDAGSLKQTQLRQTGDSWPEMNITVAGSLVSNGRDYCAQSAVIRGYFTAE